MLGYTSRSTTSIVVISMLLRLVLYEGIGLIPIARLGTTSILVVGGSSLMITERCYNSLYANLLLNKQKTNQHIAMIIHSHHCSIQDISSILGSLNKSMIALATMLLS